MQAAFVFAKCELGQIEKVAYEDVGDCIPDTLQKVPGVRDTETLLAFQAFKPEA